MQNEVSRDSRCLNRDARILLLIIGLYYISTGFSNLFVNVFLWRLNNDMFIVGIFNLFFYAFIPLGFVIGGWLSKKINTIFSLKLGILLMLMFYFTVLFLGQKASNYVALLGIFWGLGLGFFMLAFNILSFDFTNTYNRDSFNGYNGLLSSLAYMVAPYISGFIITSMPGYKGYSFIFAISFLCFIIAIFLSFSLYFIPHPDKNFFLGSVIKNKKYYNENWRKVLIGHLAIGFRDGVFMFAVNLFIYMVSGSEISLGTYNLICSIISVIAFYIIARYTNHDNRKWFMLFGALFMFVSTWGFFVKINLISLWFFGIVVSIFAPMFWAPFTSLTWDVLEHNMDSHKLKIEYMITREIVLNMGRVISVSIFILINQFFGFNILKIYLFFLGAVQILSYYLVRNIIVFDGRTFPSNLNYLELSVDESIDR